MQKIAVIKFHVLLIDQPLDTFCVSKIVKDRKNVDLKVRACKNKQQAIGYKETIKGKTEFGRSYYSA